MKEEKVKRSLAFFMVLLIGILAAMGLYYYQIFYEAKVFLPGVKISSIAVEGMNGEQASKLLSEEINKAYKRQIKFQKDDYIYECELGDLAEAIDTDAIIQNIWNQEKQLSVTEKWDSVYKKKVREYPVTIPYKPVEKTKLLADWNAKWGSALVETRLEVDRQNGLLIIPGKPATQVDEKATFELLPSGVSIDQNITIPIKLKQIGSSVDEESLRNMGELASFTSYYKTAETNRAYNLSTAANAVNGTILQPGEVFSFNGKVGSRSLETGYREAMVIVGDGYEPGIGGGICQVSSTLYNASLLAGLEIVERHNHALAVSYVPVGQDATVLYGVLDFKFKNNTEFPIYVRSVAAGGALTINIYGNITYKQSIKVRNIVDQTIPSKSITKIDVSLKPGEVKLKHGGLSGYVVRSFRDFYDQEGKLVRTETLRNSRYRPLNKLTLKGPEAVQGPVNPPPVEVPAEVDQEIQGPQEGNENVNQLPEEPEEQVESPTKEGGSQTGEADPSDTPASQNLD